MARIIKLAGVLVFVLTAVIAIGDEPNSSEEDTSTIIIKDNQVTITAPLEAPEPVDPCDTSQNFRVNLVNGSLRSAEQVPDFLKNLKFGLGIGVSTLPQPEVNKAEVVGGEVMITNQQQTRRQFWFETHYIVGQTCLKSIKRPLGHGPFVALNIVGDGGALNAIGAGWLVSLKRTEAADTTDTSAFNFGVGLQFTQFDMLGGGLKDGDEFTGSTIPLKTVDGVGLLFMFSFSF